MQNELKYDLAGVVIGLAMKVHRALGPGFLESVYGNALAIELEEAGISFRREEPLSVQYRDRSVGEFQCDFLVEEDLILELKAVSALNPAHEVQLVNYLSATGIDSGLLLNFGTKSLEYKKKVRCLPANSVNSVNPVKNAAFTILELLVAMTLMSMLLVLLLNMVDGATKLWRESENRVDSYREARAALGIMSRDLQNALSSTNNQFLVNTGAFPKISAIGSAVTNTNAGSAVFFLSALPLKAQERYPSGDYNKSDVCQVGYFLAFDRTTASTNKSLNLYRYFRSSDATFTDLTVGSLFQNPLIGSTGEELLARNVTSFRIIAYSLTANNTLTNFTTNGLPDLVDVQIKAINQDTAKKLDNNVSSWTNSASPIITPVEQTFTTRFKLNRSQ